MAGAFQHFDGFWKERQPGRVQEDSFPMERVDRGDQVFREQAGKIDPLNVALGNDEISKAVVQAREVEKAGHEHPPGLRHPGH